MVALKLVHASGTEPGSEAVRIYSALRMLKDLFPKVHRASQPFNANSTGVQILWKIPPVAAVLFRVACQVRYYGNAPPALWLCMNRRDLNCVKQARRDSA